MAVFFSAHARAVFNGLFLSSGNCDVYGRWPDWRHGWQGEVIRFAYGVPDANKHRRE
jgi:hypothetical protein